MRFEKWLRGPTGQNDKLAECYYQRDLIRWLREPDGSYTSTWEHLAEDRLETYQQLNRFIKFGGRSMLLSIECMSQALAYGPKVLELSKVDFDVLEKTDVNLHLVDYNQPFETMVVELPESYGEKHRVSDALAGRLIPLQNTLHKETHKPEFVILHHKRDLGFLFITVFMDSNDCYCMLLNDPTTTIEEEIQIRAAKDAYEQSAPMVDGEKEMYMEVVHAALNACLFVEDFGMKELGPSNPKQLRRLHHFAEVARKHKDREKSKQIAAEIRQTPTYYAFKQEVKLRVKYATEGEQTADGGWTVKPHWRRGHYRTQRFGKGLCESKRIRIDPVFVNGYLFGGDSGNTVVVHHD